MITFALNAVKAYDSKQHTMSQVGLILHAACAASLWHLKSYLAEIEQKKLEILQLRHQTYAMRLLSDELSHDSGRPSTASLFAILALACHDGKQHVTSNCERYSISPMIYAQDLHICGRAEQKSQHVTGAIAVMQRMGGLDSVRDQLLESALEV